MNYCESLNELLSLGHELRGVKFDLDAIRKLAAAQGNPHRQYPTALVAGTNGKGSTASFLASILERSGYRTGLYTSPHLIRPNERIRISGNEIDDQDFASAYTSVRESVDELIAQCALPQHPSFFETLTAMAFCHFAMSKVDFAVLEVGMGGRLDATNIAEPCVTIITNIGFDHMEFLGHTLAGIAGEKAGILRHGIPLISGVEIPEAANVIRQRATEIGAPLRETFVTARAVNSSSRDGRYTFDLLAEGENFEAIAMPLAGRFQVQNAVAAVLAARELSHRGFSIAPAAITGGIRQTTWPGRLETIMGKPLLLLDGAHNPAAARMIAQFVQEELRGRRVKLVYASMRDKAIAEIGGILFPLAHQVWVTRTNQHRAASPQEIIAAAGKPAESFRIQLDPVRAANEALEAAADDDVVLVTGSLFLVGAIRQAWIEGNMTNRQGVKAVPAARPIPEDR